MTYHNDTIAAIATPPGEGGIAVVRISGTQAISISNKLFSGDIKTFLSHTIHLGNVLDSHGHIIDQSLLLIMKAPRSFTGEDVIEFQCHGGFFASNQILNALIANGARLAQPGEFTQRAFLNNKIDLVQAEAIQKMISATNLDAFAIAKQHFQGTFSEKLSYISKLILQALAFVEVQSDFPEEVDNFSICQQALPTSIEALELIEVLLSSYDQGRSLSQGINVLLAGPPNVGKSSLLNCLLEKNRAITSDIPGTTRDILIEDYFIQGKTIKLIDSAGQRDTTDLLEKIGIDKAKQSMNEADLILWLIDASCPQNPPPIVLEKQSFIIWNKTDLASPSSSHITHPTFAISTLSGQGIPELKQAISTWLHSRYEGKSNNLLIVSTRHFQILERTKTCLEKTILNLKQSLSPELIALDLREALEQTQQLSGAKITENILGEIFNNFCIGK